MPHRYELPIISFLAVALVLLPLPWHWKARNVATLSLIAWLVLSNLIRGINSIVWMDNVRIHSRWWCDISSKIVIGVTIALPACSFCITRHLEHVASTRVAMTTAADKRRRRIIDLCITIGIPCLIMALHYVVQGHRFDIIEDIGCQPATYVSIPAVFILWVPPVVLSLGSLTYAALALRHFAVRRLEFEQHLRDSKSALTTARYMRLMALAVTEMLWGTSLGMYVVVYNVQLSGLRPWVSWANVHYNFSRVAIWPTFLVPKSDMVRILLAWWITPATAILFFLFFGFSEEALEGYASAFRWFRRVVLRQKLSPPRSGFYSKGESLPHFRKAQPIATSDFQPDDVSLAFPDLKLDLGSSLPAYEPAFRPRTNDLETASALSLTYTGPGLDFDPVTPTAPETSAPSRLSAHSSIRGSFSRPQSLSSINSTHDARPNARETSP